MGQKTDKIYKRAEVNLDEGNHENALRLFNEVLNREPSHKFALRSKGFIKILNSKPKEAEEFLLFAIDQQPEDDHLYQMLGALYHNNEEPKKALAQFRKAVDLDPANGLAQKGLAMLYAQVYGEHEKAVTHFTKAIELGTKNPDVFFYRGCSYMILEHLEKAEDDLRKAADLDHPKSKEMVEKYFD